MRLRETGRCVPYHMSIGLLSRCNHNCRWCYVDYAKQNIEMDADVLLVALQEARRIWGLKAVTIVGMGEPTLHPRFPEVVDRIRRLGVEVGLFTNGSRLAGDVARALLDATFVRISLDACTPETHQACHGSKDFGEVVANIAAFVALRGKKALPTIGIQFAACHLNKGDIVPMARMAEELGVDYLSYKPVYKNERNPSHPANELDLEEAMALVGEAAMSAKRVQVFQKREQFQDVLGASSQRPYTRCWAHSISPYVEEDGSVAFCGNLYPDSVIGNIHEHTLSEIWYGERHRKAIDALRLDRCVKGCKYHRLNIILDGFLHTPPEIHVNFI